MSEDLSLIVGLGNPGTKYTNTRHNLGFWAIDAFVSPDAPRWKEKHQGLYCEIRIEGKNRIFLKPQSYMNLSGEVVRAFLKDNYLKSENMLVIHDEADLDPGVIRLKKGGGAGGHNGLKSIMAETGSRDFYRMRLGTGKHPKMDLAAFLLSKTDPAFLAETATQAANALEDVFASGFVKAQSMLHVDTST